MEAQSETVDAVPEEQKELNADFDHDGDATADEAEEVGDEDEEVTANEEDEDEQALTADEDDDADDEDEHHSKPLNSGGAPASATSTAADADGDDAAGDGDDVSESAESEPIEKGAAADAAEDGAAVLNGDAPASHVEDGGVVDDEEESDEDGGSFGTFQEARAPEVGVAARENGHSSEDPATSLHDVSEIMIAKPLAREAASDRNSHSSHVDDHEDLAAAAPKQPPPGSVEVAQQPPPEHADDEEKASPHAHAPPVDPHHLHYHQHGEDDEQPPHPQVDEHQQPPMPQRPAMIDESSRQSSLSPEHADSGQQLRRAKELIRAYESNLRKRDESDYHRLQTVADMVNSRLRSVVSVSNEVTHFLNAQYKTQELLKQKTAQIPSLEIGTMSCAAMQAWKATAHTYSLTEPQIQLQLKMQESIQQKRGHLEELSRVVAQRKEKARRHRDEVEASWRIYEKELGNDLQVVRNGGTPKRDPYLARLQYEARVNSMENFGYQAQVSSLVDDLSISDEQRLYLTKKLLLDYFANEQRALKAKMDIVQEAINQIQSIEPADEIRAFHEKILRREEIFHVTPREDFIRESQVVSEVVVEGTLAHVVNPAQSLDVVRPCYAVLTISGFLHLFPQKTNPHPHDSMKSASISDVEHEIARHEVGDSAEAGENSSTYLLRFNKKGFFGKTSYVFKCPTEHELLAWVQSLTHYSAGVGAKRE